MEEHQKNLLGSNPRSTHTSSVTRPRHSLYSVPLARGCSPTDPRGGPVSVTVLTCHPHCHRTLTTLFAGVRPSGSCCLYTRCARTSGLGSSLVTAPRATDARGPLPDGPERVEDREGPQGTETGEVGSETEVTECRQGDHGRLGRDEKEYSCRQ